MTHHLAWWILLKLIWLCIFVQSCSWSSQKWGSLNLFAQNFSRVVTLRSKLNLSWISIEHLIVFKFKFSDCQFLIANKNTAHCYSYLDRFLMVFILVHVVSFEYLTLLLRIDSILVYSHSSVWTNFTSHSILLHWVSMFLNQVSIGVI